MKRKCADVKDELWQYLKGRAKRNGRTVHGELNFLLEGLKKRDKAVQ